MIVIKSWWHRWGERNSGQCKTHFRGGDQTGAAQGSLSVYTCDDTAYTHSPDERANSVTSEQGLWLLEDGIVCIKSKFLILKLCYGDVRC